MGSSHTIRAGGISGVEFDTVYDVEVTAISVCGSESEAKKISVIIEANGEGKIYIHEKYQMYCISTIIYFYVIFNFYKTTVLCGKRSHIAFLQY